MKKFKIIFIIGLVFMLSCVDMDESHKPRIPMMTISTGSVGAGHYNICSSIADWVNSRVMGYPITAVPGSGGIGNPIRVGRKDADIGVSYSPFLKMAVEGGKEPFTQPFPNLRAICSLTSNFQHILAARDIDAVTFEDVAGKKIGLNIATGFPGTSDRFILQLIMAEVGINEETIKEWGGNILQIGTSGRVDLWKDRHINALHSSIEYPAAAITEAMASRKGKLLGLSEEVSEELIRKYGFAKAEIPAKSYPGQNDPIPTLKLTMVIFTTEDIDEEAVYIFTKTIAENQEKLRNSFGSFKNWNAEDMIRHLGIPIHRGAVKYYKERGWM